MKNKNTEAPNQSANPKIDPTVIEAENPHAVGYSMMDLREMKIEKNLQIKLKSVDPAKQDFSEEFFERLHDKVMAAVEHVEIRTESESMVARLARKTQLKLLGRTFPSVLAALVVTLSLGALAQRGAIRDATSELNTPEMPEIL
jgi:hypothetical protein